MDAVVMVLQLLRSCVPRPTTPTRSGALWRVARHCRRRRIEPEREAERFAHDVPEAASERDVDDEISGRVDDH